MYEMLKNVDVKVGWSGKIEKICVYLEIRTFDFEQELPTSAGDGSTF